MRDSIDRQTAIDALTEHAEWLQERYHETCSLPGMIRVIEELPSAQPEPCEDAVSRQAAIDAIKNTYGLSYIEDGFNRQDAVSILEELPSVTPKMRTGKWIPVTNGRGGHECDQCHSYAPAWQTGKERLTDYCPNCGSFNGEGVAK